MISDKKVLYVLHRNHLTTVIIQLVAKADSLCQRVFNSSSPVMVKGQFNSVFLSKNRSCIEFADLLAILCTILAILACAYSDDYFIVLNLYLGRKSAHITVFNLCANDD